MLTLSELLLCCSLSSDLARSSLIFHMELGAKNNPPPSFVSELSSCSEMAAGVASGATRAALTQHFALRKNAADVSAKVPG